ncbi:MAG: NAD-dependent dehydratase [Ignavibacteriae bacterium HGW-Ignavibacteriae-3]|nr:MAG: NAD-dependent dehydratase [Ignavibacteriae bacterium HGW-Ignavibacteriae-3]
MKILFIGGTGVISTACSNLCIKRGYDLYLLNRGLSFRKVGPEANFINADIRDADSARSALANEKFDVVVDWIAYNEEHVNNDYELFRDKTDQYIFISSASAYHKPPLKLPITENTPLHNPFWSYSQGKIDAENYLMNIFNEEKFPVTICRPSHTYDKTKIALYGGYTVLNRMKAGKKVIIHEDGNTIWTLTSAKDFAKGFIGLLGNSETIGEAYHITSDQTLTWNNIAEITAEAAGLELQIVHIPSEFIAGHDSEWGCNLLGDKGYNTFFDNSKIKSIVPEFKTDITYSEGIREIIEWYNIKENQIVNEELDKLMDKMIEEYRQSGI